MIDSTILKRGQPGGHLVHVRAVVLALAGPDPVAGDAVAREHELAVGRRSPSCRRGPASPCSAPRPAAAPCRAGSAGRGAPPRRSWTRRGSRSSTFFAASGSSRVSSPLQVGLPPGRLVRRRGRPRRCTGRSSRSAPSAAASTAAAASSVGKKLSAADRLGPHPRVLVGRGGLEQVERVRDAVPLVGQRSGRRRRGRRRSSAASTGSSNASVDGVVPLLDPERLAAQPVDRPGPSGRASPPRPSRAGSTSAAGRSRSSRRAR